MKTAEIVFDETGTPCSQLYDDRYFSRQGAAGECHHVFLKGIGAPEIWHHSQRFCLGELGFGAGLNFLHTWKFWRETANPGSILDYFAIEGRPLSRADLANILSGYKDLKQQVSCLLDQYPPPISGFHHLIFDQGRVRLTLALGPADQMIKGIRGAFDAWYLDGFSPAKNPEMWSEALIKKIANLSVKGAPVATYSVAGLVRRSLKASGFETEIRDGFGPKKQCLRGYFRGTGLKLPAFGSSVRIAVIGSGIAGLAVAWSLKRRGFEAILIDQSSDAPNQASGNPAALIDPKFTLGNDAYCRFQLLAFYHCVRFYNQLAAENEMVWHGREGIISFATSATDQERALKICSLFQDMTNGPRVLTEPILKTTGSGAHDGTIWKPGGYVSPAAIASITKSELGESQTAYVASLQRSGNGWTLQDEKGDEILHAEAVILANGLDAARMAPEASLPMRASRGQISFLPPLTRHPLPDLPITFGGYLTPPVPVTDHGEMHVLVATFDDLEEHTGDHWRAFSTTGHQECLNSLARVQPEQAAAWRDSRAMGRTGLRATTPDFLPMLGPVTSENQIDAQAPKPALETDWSAGKTSGLFIMAGLGSLGFQSAPYMAEILVALMAGAPLPADEACRAILDPARFCWRGKRRGE